LHEQIAAAVLSDKAGLAKQMVDGHAIELWHEARMIAAFEPEK